MVLLLWISTRADHLSSTTARKYIGSFIYIAAQCATITKILQYVSFEAIRELGILAILSTLHFLKTHCALLSLMLGSLLFQST